MRRVCSWAVLVTIVAGVGARAAPASAGGSTFSFNRHWFAPGQHVAGSAQFSTEVRETGKAADGPYFAYLLPGESWIEPPELPRKAIRLAMVKMRPVRSGIWEASIGFVVPDVRPGSYMVSLCNHPCRNAFVGDLVGAWISVAASREQAKMKNLEARIEERVAERLSDTTSAMQQDLELLRESVAAEQSRTMSVATELRLKRIDDQIKAMGTDLRNLRARADQGLIAWLWLAGWLVAGAIAAAWWRSRRRRAQLAGRMPAGSVTTQTRFLPDRPSRPSGTLLRT